MFAAWRDNKSASEFSKMPGAYQAMIVAAYKAEKQIEAVLSEDREIRYRQQQAEDAARRNSQGLFR